MLTDIFAHRYANTALKSQFTEHDQRLLVQGFRIVVEQLYPYWVSGKESESAKNAIKRIHDKLSMELGLESLSSRAYAYQTMWNGSPHTMSGTYTYDNICKNFVCKNYDGSDASRFMAERISFFELAFREREQEIKAANAKLPLEVARAKAGSSKTVTTVPPKNKQDKLHILNNALQKMNSDLADRRLAENEYVNAAFKANVDELNTRFRQAGYNLNYHNGYIQMSSDELSQKEFEKPFWDVVSSDIWKNVDIDMKEAIDLRDNGGRDPAFYAAKALESAIKIISNAKGWSTGSEKGAHNYIDNLASKRANHFISDWESEALKLIFTKVRNPFGHGPGDQEMPMLSPQQTDWAIESCMVWVKSLTRRM